MMIQRRMSLIWRLIIQIYSEFSEEENVGLDNISVSDQSWFGLVGWLVS